MKLTLVYDGGCIFCSHFALRSELTSGIAKLRIRDGRKNRDLLAKLKARGFDLSQGAILTEGNTVWHGSSAIVELSRRMKSSDPLLDLLSQIFRVKLVTNAFYPVFLFARRVVLKLRGLPLDPDDKTPGNFKPFLLRTQKSESTSYN
ncbi:DCC1-like thiol-disulfide oxidoreductase family protein [Synechococcus sp. M16CYN]|uniref:DCC1-like thiol-disulfide oxidoreductase family protein n=1 Tax=Synechococcus sp. M16CYN TaxID=3103139 RepID=UPI00324C817F